MSFMVLFSIAVILLVLLVILDYWKKRYWISATKNFDGPFAWPIIGNALLFRCKNDDILQNVSDILVHKSPFRLWMGPELIVGSDIPRHVEKVLSSVKLANKYDYLYDIIKPYLGEGLVSASGPNHKKHRRIIQPHLNLNFCANVLSILQKHINFHLTLLDTKYCQNNNDDEYFDICTDNHKCFVDFVCEVFMGTKINAQKGENKKFIQAAIDMYRLGINKMTKPWLRFNFIYKMTKEYKHDMLALKEFRRFGEKVVRDSEERRTKGIQYDSEMVPIIDEVLDFIEENPGVISRTEFVDHMLTLYAASEDTLSLNSSFAAVCFGMKPEYQKKAYEEIREVMGDQVPENVTVDDLNRLPFLDRCVKDVMRLFPIAPYIVRRINEDFELDEYVIPKGVGFMVPIFNMHRNPEYWERPNDFYPDHFLSEAVNKRPIYSYVPFSAGPRGCIGKILANLTIKLYLCNLLLNYEITSFHKKMDDLKLRMDISVRPIEGYVVKIKKRNC